MRDEEASGTDDPFASKGTKDRWMVLIPDVRASLLMVYGVVLV